MIWEASCYVCTIFYRKTFKKIIISAAVNHIDEYKSAVAKASNSIEKFIDNPGGLLLATRTQYLDAVSEEVFDKIRQAPTTAGARLSIVIMNPKICGYDIDITYGILGGSVYAMCFYALTGKAAKSKDCIELNHVHNAIMDNALAENDKR